MGCECMHVQGQLFAYDRQETLRKACVSLWAYLQKPDLIWWRERAQIVVFLFSAKGNRMVALFSPSASQGKPTEKRGFPGHAITTD